MKLREGFSSEYLLVSLFCWIFLREICGSLPGWIQYFNFFVPEFLCFLHIMTVFLMQRIHYFLNLIDIIRFSCFYLKHSIINSIFIYTVDGFSTPFWCCSPHAIPQIIIHMMPPFHTFINPFSLFRYYNIFCLIFFQQLSVYYHFAWKLWLMSFTTNYGC